MSESEESAALCPRCGTLMITGHLRAPANVIFVESLFSTRDSSLTAWICPACGHVELEATHPERLARHDIADRDLFRQDEWQEWERRR
jgi:predicted RNA-binding Zn-ribbon protein involved in translation (DUF1610 family)